MPHSKHESKSQCANKGSASLFPQDDKESAGFGEHTCGFITQPEARQEDCSKFMVNLNHSEFQTRLDYSVRSCHKTLTRSWRGGLAVQSLLLLQRLLSSIPSICMTDSAQPRVTLPTRNQMPSSGPFEYTQVYYKIKLRRCDPKTSWYP